MNIIVTGATGFIGSDLCSEMLKAGHSVTAVVRPNSPKKEKLPDGVFVIEMSLDELCNLTGKYDVFYHLAWNGCIGGDRDNFDIQHTNIKYTKEAVKAAKRCGCFKFVGAGSQAEYGVVHGLCNEETAPNPFMMYGAAKLAAYHMGRLVAEQEGISFVWPRIYSVYGVGESEGTVLSYVVSTLLKGEAPKLSSCENMWDFLYVTDCAAALGLLGEKKDAHGIYNVSYGKPKPLKEFILEIRDMIAPNTEICFGARKTDKNKTFWLEPDVSKLKNEGFEPKIGFPEGIYLKTEAVKGGL
ncbi:MAG: NAD-dependent epimerase/dehydratase family protein [Clostridia bacterium]|nr:NAD-dependent epimerase/dehydratase family protein [Clostridia bacterium]